MLSINAARGFEFGSGFDAVRMKGSEHNDLFIVEKDNPLKIRTKTNFSGGIQGGISNGEPIYFNVAFKPPSGIQQVQTTVIRKGEYVEIKPGGRYDTCLVPRVIPVVEAMAALVLADHLLINRASRI